jgi:phosphate transport system substrate-binding protein
MDIVVVHRSDASGTSYIFTDYLSAVSPDWQAHVGKDATLNWPVGLGGRGNEGVVVRLKETPGSIGYLELTYALQNQMAYAEIRNRDHYYTKASLESITAALTTATIPDDFRFSMVNAPGKDAYPIAGATWLLIYDTQRDPVRGEKLVAFLKWTETVCGDSIFGF